MNLFQIESAIWTKGAHESNFEIAWEKSQPSFLRNHDANLSSYVFYLYYLESKSKVKSGM